MQQQQKQKKKQKTKKKKWKWEEKPRDKQSIIEWKEKEVGYIPSPKSGIFNHNKKVTLKTLKVKWNLCVAV